MKEPLPPHWAIRLLERFLSPSVFKGVYGDLLEDFYRNIQQYGLKKARWLFIQETLGYLRYPSLFKQPFFTFNPFVMLPHYFKTIFRNLYKRKRLSLINILGLAFGVLVCILMTFYIQDELTYDHFHQKGARIHRITIAYKADENNRVVSKMTFPAKGVLLEEYPEVEKVVRFYTNASLNNIPLLQYGNKSFTEENFLFTDPEIFEVFDFKLLKGNPQTALAAHNNVLITEKIAKKYFGNEDPMGKTMRYQNETDLVVTGIVQDLPSNSHIQFDFLAPINLHRYKWMGGVGGTGYDLEQDWNWAGCWLFALLKRGVEAPNFEQKVQAIAKKYLDEPGKLEFVLKLQTLPDIHFNAFPTAEMSAGGNRTQVYGLSIIVFLILLIAGINYMNLATARASERAKEVGVRKVLGAGKKQLVYQFLGEAIFIALIAVLIAGFLANWVNPYFNQIVDKDLVIPLLSSPKYLGLLLGIGLLIGIIAGLYPAFVLSRFKPISAMRQVFSTTAHSGISIRKVLVVLQFAISTTLIIGVLVVWQQLEYLRNKELGFQKDNVVLIKNGWAISQQLPTLKSELEVHPTIQKVYRGFIPGKPAFNNTFEVEGKTEAERMGVRHIGMDFFEMFDVPIIQGRSFVSNNHLDSTQSIIINETALQQLNWTKEEAIGKMLGLGTNPNSETRYNLKVIGIVKDANFRPLHQTLNPIVFKYGNFGDVAIKVQGQQLAESLQAIENTWQKVIPDWPLEYTFLDESLAQKYLKEEKLQSIIQYFTGLAIFIALIGLLGLISLTIQQRYKEIGIRKVLGASIVNIIGLLSWDFIKLMVIAILLACPIAWYLMNGWLQDFAYRISVSWWIFVAAGLATILLTLLIISWQTIKAATHNPVDSLKVE